MVAGPLRGLILLMAIGVIDLVSTAVLHAKGLIVEMNPVMRFFIERGEWAFALAKGLTLAIACAVMLRYMKKNPQFVNSACLWGSAAYVGLWCAWFFGAR